MQGFVTNGVINGKSVTSGVYHTTKVHPKNYASAQLIFSVLDIHATEEIAGDDVEGWSLRGDGMCGMIADATDEALAFHFYVDRRGHEEFDTATEGMDVDFLIFSNHGLAQIQSDATAESIEPSTVEGLAMIDVLVATIVNRTADTLAVLTNRQWAPQPLVGIATVAVDNQMYAHP